MRTMIAVLLLTTVAQAAPVPKLTAKEKVEAKFGGKIVAPKGDTDFKMDGDTLVVTLPAKQVCEIRTESERFLNFRIKDNCPEVRLKEMTGDFEIEYKVTVKLSPAAKAASKSNLSVFSGAGTRFDFKDDETFAIAMWNYRSGDPDAKPRPGLSQVSTCNTFGFRGASRCEAHNGFREADWKIRIRFQETKVRYYCDFGKVGEQKFSAQDHEYDNTVPVKVALIFLHASDTAHEVRIDDFKIKPIGKK